MVIEHSSKGVVVDIKGVSDGIKGVFEGALETNNTSHRLVTGIKKNTVISTFG